MVAGIPAKKYEKYVEIWAMDGSVPSTVQHVIVGTMGTACWISAGVEKSREQAAKDQMKMREHAIKLATLQSQPAGVTAAPGGSAAVSNASGGQHGGEGRVIKLTKLMRPSPQWRSSRPWMTNTWRGHRIKGDVPRLVEDVAREQLMGLRSLFSNLGFEVWSRVLGLGFTVSGYGFEFSD
ncbi:unnamed protein product [Prorocentrum cordatum]|uniref:Mitochondrial fission process protein 1 n=1 Tax=Prorocentrum cordatum TaxID=2364126 RepID=A0ABN9VXR4_9DINO|nr:unnamed protein product [Polarella glacialis]